MAKLDDKTNSRMGRKVQRLLAMKNDREDSMTSYEQTTLVSISQQLRKGYKLSINQASWLSCLESKMKKAGQATKSMGSLRGQL